MSSSTSFPGDVPLPRLTLRYFPAKIPYPADLGDWSRQKDGVFKQRMQLDPGDLKTLQVWRWLGNSPQRLLTLRPT
jgi:hypothetical protein